MKGEGGKKGILLSLALLREKKTAQTEKKSTVENRERIKDKGPPPFHLGAPLRPTFPMFVLW